ncbi:MAG: M14 family zinc carboxypeptidase [Candidatus Zixiibacteriota bacterium]
MNRGTRLNILQTIIVLLVFATAISAGVSEYYIEIQVDSQTNLNELTRLISIDNIKGNTVFAYGTPQQLANLENRGYFYKSLPHPGSLFSPKMGLDKNSMADWDVYPTYPAYVAMMYQFQADFPEYCQIIDAGSSVMDHQILVARISDNIELEEDEPEVFLTSSMHGDETTGYVLMLRLIDYLLQNYGNNELISRLVDSCEIWINPLANPDGTYSTGDNAIYLPTRFNAMGVDLNRNYPDPDDGPHPDGNGWQAETTVMMNLAAAQSFCLAVNFHGGAEVINYPWDTWSRLHTDDNWFIDISRDYADSAQYYSPANYLTDRNNGITNGYAWYPITGGRQDYMNYWHGCREVLIEISDIKFLPESLLLEFWNYNRSSFLHYIENALFGIRGVVTDEQTGLPLLASIRIPSHDSDLDSSRVFTDPDVGDYHRMIEPGTYDIEFTSAGYDTLIIYDIDVSENNGIRLDVSLSIPPPYVCGDANNDSDVNIGDAVFIINLIFKGGLPPEYPEAADANSDGRVNVGDAVFLINFTFKGGSPPECD